MDWDPTPGRVGLDHLAVWQGGIRLNHVARGVVASVPATANGSVTAITTHVTDVVDAPTLKCEVYDVGAPSATPTTSTYRPNEDVTFAFTGSTTMAGVSVDTAGNRYQNIDESTTNDADYIYATQGSGSGTGTYAFRVNSSAGFGAGDQTVAAVRLHLRMNWIASPDSRVTVYYTTGGVDYTLGTLQSASLLTNPTTHIITLFSNPSTGLSWTEAQIQALDSTGSFKLAFTMSGAAHFNLQQAYVEVDWRNQPLLGSASVTVTSDGAAVFPVAFTKSSGTTYRIAVRRTSSSGSCVIPTLDSGETHPGGHGSYIPTLDEAGTVTDYGDLQTAVIPILFTVSAAYDADSQPYKALRWEAVDVAHTVIQEVTRPSTATVGWLSLVAGSARSVIPAADLLGKIRAAGGGAQQGGTATFAVQVLEDAPLAPRAIEATMASTASLTNATQYDIEYTSAAEEGTGWKVAVLEAITGAGAVTFGGTTDRGEVDATESDVLDVATVMGTVPTAPSGFTATANTAGVGSIDLAWTATALGADFERYEIERLHADGTFRVIAYITTEATDEYMDEPALRGVEEEYRIRVRHANDTLSLPSTSDLATLDKRYSYILSPSDPSLSHRVVIVGDSLSWTRPLERVESFRYGSNYMSVIKGRRRGKSLSFTILLDEGPESFASQDDWVQALEEADDLVLVNEFGERLFGDLSAPAGTSLSPGVHLLPMVFTETQGSQTIVEV